MNWKDGQGSCRGKRGVMLRTGVVSGRSSLRLNGESTANCLGNLSEFYSLERTRQNLDNRTPVGERFVFRPGPAAFGRMYPVLSFQGQKIRTQYTLQILETNGATQTRPLHPHHSRR